MYVWLIGVALAVLVWAMMWQSQPKMAFGVLLGLPIAWMISRLISPYVTGMEQVPIWLPPLPFAIVAILLLVLGGLIWFRGAPPLPQDREEPHHH
jgi:hypothetical protein